VPDYIRECQKIGLRLEDRRHQNFGLDAKARVEAETKAKAKAKANVRRPKPELWL